MGEGEESKVDTDEWVKSAMSDDLMVAEILMVFGTVALAEKPAPTSQALRWGLRQPRSRQILRSAILKAQSEGDARASPTTPLSWSPGSSLSGYGAADGCDDSSRSGRAQNGVVASGDSRSRAATNESSPSRSTIRKAKKKKTFTELKEEENKLLADRVKLKKDLELLQIGFEELKEQNERLKKIKLQTGKETTTMASVVFKEASQEQLLLCTEVVTVDRPPDTVASNATCSYLVTERCPTPKTEVNAPDTFMLPDLNLPLEEDSVSEMLYGMS